MGADAIAFCLEQGHSWDTGAKPYCLVCGIDTSHEYIARDIYEAGKRDGRAAVIADLRSELDGLAQADPGDAYYQLAMYIDGLAAGAHVRGEGDGDV